MLGSSECPESRKKKDRKEVKVGRKMRNKSNEVTEVWALIILGRWNQHGLIVQPKVKTIFNVLAKMADRGCQRWSGSGNDRVWEHE